MVVNATVTDEKTRKLSISMQEHLKEVERDGRFLVNTDGGRYSEKYDLSDRSKDNKKPITQVYYLHLHVMHTNPAPHRNANKTTPRFFVKR
jgi:hypothetical protein